MWVPARLLVFLAATALLAACGSGNDNRSGAAALVPGPGECLVGFSLVDGENVGILQARGDFTSVGGTLLVDGSFGRCSSRLVAGEAALTIPIACVGEDCARRPRLTVRLDRPLSLSAPAVLMECLFTEDADGSLDADAFVFEIEDASSPDFAPIDPLPTIGVTTIACDVGVSTTTTTPASACDTVDCGPTEVCSEGECVATDTYEIEIGVTDDALYGGLQFNAYYPREAGAFVGSGSDVRCKSNPENNAYTAYNHETSPDLASPVLRLASSSLQGIDAPVWLTRCLFRSSGGPVDADIFDLELVDASDREAHFLDAHFAVTAVRPVLAAASAGKDE